MDRAVATARLVMLVALSCLCVGGCLVAVKVLAELDAVTLATRQLSAAKVGIIPLVEDDLRNLRLALDNANQAAMDERFFLERAQPIELAKINAILDNSNRLLAETARRETQLSAQALTDLQTTDATLKGLQPLEVSLGATVTALTATAKDLDKLVGDPENLQTLANVQTGTAAMAETAKDGQQWFYQALHPSWAHRIWGLMLDVAHVFNPL